GAVESQSPTEPYARARTNRDRRRLEAQDRPEAHAELACLILRVFLARSVEREQVASRVLEAHPLAVVATQDSLDAALFVHGEGDHARSGIARVLQELTDEDPRIGAISSGLEPRSEERRVGKARGAGRGH